jgi:hypothetical protein
MRLPHFPTRFLHRAPHAHARHPAQAGEQAVQIGLHATARLCGKNQSTIHRAMKTGRLSYTVGEAGERRIDVSELERVFGLRYPQGEVPMLNGASSGTVAHAVQSNATHASDIAALERLLAEREASIARQDETIRDLRARLDGEVEERLRVQERLTGLLTHRQAGSVPAVPRTQTISLPRLPWWKRWFH